MTIYPDASFLEQLNPDVFVSGNNDQLTHAGHTLQVGKIKQKRRGRMRRGCSTGVFGLSWGVKFAPAARRPATG
jgi:hypothetical protein